MRRCSSQSEKQTCEFLKTKSLPRQQNRNVIGYNSTACAAIGRKWMSCRHQMRANNSGTVCISKKIKGKIKNTQATHDAQNICRNGHFAMRERPMHTALATM